MNPSHRDASRALTVIGRVLAALLAAATTLAGCFFLATTTGVIAVNHEAPRRDRARLDLGNLEGAARIFNRKHGRPPADIEEFITAGILEKKPRDPWDNPYRYWPTGELGVFVSLGADKACGGMDAAADLISQNAPPGWDPCTP